MCLAVPGKILEINGEDPYFRTGRVSFGGIIKQVSLACVPEARVDDYVLVHVGMALSVVDEKEAAEVFTYLKAMGELEDLATPSGGVTNFAATSSHLYVNPGTQLVTAKSADSLVHAPFTTPVTVRSTYDPYENLTVLLASPAPRTQHSIRYVSPVIGWVTPHQESLVPPVL